MSARQDIEFDDIYSAAKEISLERSEIVMTIAEQLINEGMQKGLQKGILSAKLETSIHLLTRKFGVLPEELQNKLQMADADTLNLILDNILDIASLEDVAKYLQK